MFRRKRISEFEDTLYWGFKERQAPLGTKINWERTMQHISTREPVKFESVEEEQRVEKEFQELFCRLFKKEEP